MIWYAGKREEGEGGGSGGSGGHAGLRLLSALLTEMDGMELATGLSFFYFRRHTFVNFCISLSFRLCVLARHALSEG